jgi:HTH-type transcriptional regulator/antitoxin HigA
VVWKMLMDEREFRQSDLLPVFGNRAAVSRVLNGSRAISKTQAKKLAEFFRVPADLFI